MEATFRIVKDPTKGWKSRYRAQLKVDNPPFWENMNHIYGMTPWGVKRLLRQHIEIKEPKPVQEFTLTDVMERRNWR